MNTRSMMAVAFAVLALGGAQAQEAASLADLSARKRAAYAEPEESRRDALLAVAAAYETLARTEARSRGERAEAAFRAGEIVRTHGEAERAASLFALATSVGAPDAEEDADALEFAARGLLERAHLYRRADEVDAAVSAYAEVGERFGAHRRSVAHATTWRGKLLLASGRLDEAEPVLLGFAEAFPEYPEEAVRNADLLALRLLEAGERDRARAVVERIEAAMAPRLGDDDPAAARVAAALAAMKASGALDEVPASG